MSTKANDDIYYNFLKAGAAYCETQPNCLECEIDGIAGCRCFFNANSKLQTEDGAIKRLIELVNKWKDQEAK
jgi:hypothetical protein